MSKQLVNDFLTAISILTDDAIAKSGAMVMTEAVIKEEKTENNQYYLITISGEDKSAIGEDGYKQGDVVYISNTNISGQYPVIQGLVAEYKANVKAYQTDADTYDANSDILNTRISSSISFENLEGDEEISLYDDTNKIINIYEADLLRNLAKSSALKIKATFDYHCATNHELDYGLEFIFDNKVFKISIDDVVGNPFDSGENGQEVVKIFALQKDEVISDLQQIKLYIKNKKANDIFQLKDLAIYGAINNSNLEAGYSTYITGDSSIFTENDESLSFSVYMKKDGVKILEASGDDIELRFEWESFLGDKWMSLSTRSAQSSSFILFKEDVFIPEIKIRCIGRYYEKGVEIGSAISREKIIKNNDKSTTFLFNIFQTQGDRVELKNLLIEPVPGYREINNNISYLWKKDEEVLQKTSNSLENIDASLITKGLDTYYCEIRYNGLFVQMLSYTIYLVARADQERVVILGAKPYLYDGGGNLRDISMQPSPLEVFFYDQDHNIINYESDEKDGDGNFIKNYSVQWSLKESAQDSAIMLGESLHDKKLEYSLKTPISRISSNNTICVTVQKTDKSEPPFIAETTIGIVFSGDPGSNGSNYICSIVPAKITNSEGEVENRWSVINTYPQYVQLQPNDEILLKPRLDNVSTGVSLLTQEDKIDWLYQKENGTWSPILFSGADAEIADYLSVQSSNNGYIFAFKKPTIIQIKVTQKTSGNIYYGYLNIAIILDSNYLLDPSSGYCQVIYSSSQQLQSYRNNNFKIIKNGGEGQENIIIKKLPPPEKYPSVSKMIVYNFPDDNDPKIILPILYHINRYEYASINEWDGQNISVEGDAVLAPMAGFGNKDEASAFTGTILGSVKKDGEINADEGIYGFNKGKQTFALSAKDGSAIFGIEGGGQIKLKPDEDGIIESGNFKINDSIDGINNGSGMQINLTKPEIRWGSGNFVVNENGHLTAVNGIFSGSFKAPNFQVAYDANNNTSTIHIGALNKGISVNTDGQITLHSDVIINGTVSKLQVQKENKNLFYADATKSAVEIGGFTVSKNTLEKIQVNSLDSQQIGLCTDSSVGWAFWAGYDSSLKNNGLKGDQAPFHIGHDGELFASKATITGNITGSTISGSSITTLDGTFSVTANGTLTAKNGIIGPLTIGTDNGESSVFLTDDKNNPIFSVSKTKGVRIYKGKLGSTGWELSNGLTNYSAGWSTSKIGTSYVSFFEPSWGLGPETIFLNWTSLYTGSSPSDLVKQQGEGSISIKWDALIYVLHTLVS